MFKIVVVAIILVTSQVKIFVSTDSFPNKEACLQVLATRMPELQARVDKDMGKDSVKMKGACMSEDEINKTLKPVAPKDDGSI